MKFAIFFLAILPFADQEYLTEHTLKVKAGTNAAKAELSQFGFLQGAWRGTGFGAKCDEMWSVPAGNCMLGTFRMVKDGQLQFTEFCMLQKDADGGIVLRLKHFNSDFKGWENQDKFVSFPLVKVEKKAAYFGGLTYSVQPDGKLNVWVALEQKDGVFDEVALCFERVEEPAK